MESHTENTNGGYPTDATTTIPPVASISGGVPPPVVGWSEEFECEMVDGVLSPCPISILTTKTSQDENKTRPESSESVWKKRRPGSPSASKGENEPELSQCESSKRKRRTEGSEEIFFKLFKFEKPEEYLLETHEPKRGLFDRSPLVVNENNGKWKIGKSGLTKGRHCVVPVLEDPSPLKFPQKYLLSLQERLIGWTVEIRRRTNGKEDKFYYHRGRQFRSFVEVTTFILYSCKPKNLKTSHQDSALEAEAAEAMVIIASQDHNGKGAAEPTKAESMKPPPESNEKPELEVDADAQGTEDANATAIPNEGGTAEVADGGPNKPEEIEENPFVDLCDICDDVDRHSLIDIFRD